MSFTILNNHLAARCPCGGGTAHDEVIAKAGPPTVEFAPAPTVEVEPPQPWGRLGYIVQALLRGCGVCGSRRRCWLRWHVEVFACPVCDRQVDEFDPAFEAVVSECFGLFGPAKGSNIR